MTKFFTAVAAVLLAVQVQAAEIWSPPASSPPVVNKGGDSGGTSFGGGSPGWLMLVGVGLVIWGGVLLRKGKNLLLGAGLLVAGIALTLYHVGMQLAWKWNPLGFHLFWWVLLAVWGISLMTDKFKWDDRLLKGGTVAALVLSIVARSLLGSWAPTNPGWWVLVVVAILILLPSFVEHLKDRPGPKWFAIGLIWFVLGALS